MMNKQSKETLNNQWELLKPIAVAAILVITWCAISVVNSHAEVTRGCKGSFNIEVLNASGSDRFQQLDEFEGRGACKNKHHGNTCRKRAMDNIFRCGNDIWNNRWNLIGDPNDGRTDMILPAICRGDKTGARKVGFRTNPFGRGTDIKYSMEYHACCNLQPGADELKLKLTVTSSGDKGCGKNRNEFSKVYWEKRTLESNYIVDCNKIIEKGYCATRTGG